MKKWYLNKIDSRMNNLMLVFLKSGYAKQKK